MLQKKKSTERDKIAGGEGGRSIVYVEGGREEEVRRDGRPWKLGVELGEGRRRLTVGR